MGTGVLAATASAVIVGVSRAALRDYRQWRSLGDGGVPGNAFGYAVVCALRLLKREPLSARPYAAFAGKQFNNSWITVLPPRSGPRPSIDPHPIPQRQVDQRGQHTLIEHTQQLFDSVVAANSRLHFAPSGFETRHQAVTLLAADSANRVVRRAKATKVLNAGWGERHALAGLGPLPLTYLMIYAPRCDDELAVLGDLLDAAIAYMSQ
jgi:hypothetical protein